MRLFVIAALVGTFLLAAAPAAEAKLCVQIDAPRTARTGGSVTVRVTTMSPTWEGNTVVHLTPEPTSLRLRLSVRGPRGDVREVPLRRTRNPAVWSARLALASRGIWTLSVFGWEYAPRTCAPPWRMRVR